LAAAISDGPAVSANKPSSLNPSTEPGSRGARSRQRPWHAAWRDRLPENSVKSECVESVALSFLKKLRGFAALYASEREEPARARSPESASQKIFAADSSPFRSGRVCPLMGFEAV
jgi:hypothetical protein